MPDPWIGGWVLVTGASRGIGAATVTRLVALGMPVVRLARSTMPTSDGVVDVAADLADPVARDQALQRIAAAHGTPSAIVNNAGAFVVAPLEATSDAILREQLAINLEAPFAVARAFLPAMRARGSGTHVLVGSVADARGFAGNTAYAASKFGARGMHEALCEEFRGSGVRCTLVSPGPTDTSVWDPVDPDHHEGFLPRRKMMRPGDVADAIVFALTRPPHVHLESIRLGPE